MARRPDLEIFAEKHQMKIGTIEDLIRYRVENERTIERAYKRDIATELGDFRVVAYQHTVSNEVHLALVKGDIQAGDEVLVRVHLEDELADLLFIDHSSSGWPLRTAMKRINAEGKGVIIILRHPTQTPDILKQLKAFESQPVVQDNDDSSPADLKTYGIGAQILADLGVQKMRVMSSPKRFLGIAGFGLEVVEYIQD